MLVLDQNYFDINANYVLTRTGQYIISGEQYASLDKAEQMYWHYHKTEIPRAHATLPDLTAEETAPLLGPIGSTYGKVIYFQKPGDKLPVGEPYILVVQDLPEQD